MIPPLAPGQSDEGRNMVAWKNTFDMRQVTLMNLAASHLVLRDNTHSQLNLNCVQSGCITSPVKSLDTLRKNIQTSINKDIDNVIKKYIEKFFHPAINNIRNNLGQESVNENHIKDACCKMLDEAKLMYISSARSRDSSPYDCSDSETGSLLEYRFGRPTVGTSLCRKRKESDTDSEASGTVQKRLKSELKGDNKHVSRVLLKRDSPKWNPERITSKTLFIMGARANKVLGYGQKRGRLYVRHPELVKYSGDQEDKEWLALHQLMPPTRGKAYLMILEDIRELTKSDDYKNSPDLQLCELKGFEVPQFMTSKIRLYMENARMEAKLVMQAFNLELFDFHTSQSMTPPSTALDSAPSTPSDTIQMLDCHSVSTQSSNTNTMVHIPDMSPGSNHSFISGPRTQSPVSSNQVTTLPNSLAGFASMQPMSSHQHMTLPIMHSNSSTSLSELLASHINDNCEEQEF